MRIMRLETHKVMELVEQYTANLPLVVACIVVEEDLSELISVSLGYLPRNQLKYTNLYNKLLNVANSKFSPVSSIKLAQTTTYELLIVVESFIEKTFKIKLHYTTHFIEIGENGIHITEFDVPVKQYAFHECPTCNRIKMGGTDGNPIGIPHNKPTSKLGTSDTF